MAGSGGKRAGAGRPKGGKNKATLDAAAQIAASTARFAEFDGAKLTLKQVAAMSPLDVLRHAMLVEAVQQNWAGAALYAKELAPYQFAKLTSAKVDATVRRSLEDFTDDELDALIGVTDESEIGESEADGGTE